ncbi:calcitonin gene-related peptide type 1 receptor-like [Aricia agestis]|uniref:calcitonin gene-related peptide type 1 receptor-like n=1 Tax=Aricia agestis TaxID=91739 RepID=UPI001C20BD20|nr:calcitonin gene-related peptide type 1 receptor-like [Aricia agestis]
MFAKMLMIWATAAVFTGVLTIESMDEIFINQTLSYSALRDKACLVALIKRCYIEDHEATNDTACKSLFYSYMCSKHFGHTEKKCETFVIGVIPSGSLPLECNDNFYGLHPSVAEDHEPIYCMDEAREMRKHPGKIIAHIVGYSTSVTALAAALMMFFCIRTLQSTLGRIQKQVYIAVLINNLLWIIWYMTILYDIRFITGNKLICKIFHVAVNYFLATSYFWLLALCFQMQELVKTLVVENMWPFFWYGLLGWGAPLVVVSTYTASRYFLEDTDSCWLRQVNSSIILALPNTIVVIYSFSVVLWLLGKTTSDILKGTNESTKVASLKAAHASLFQLLLLGILMLLLPLRPSSELNDENVIWDIVWILLQNSQGIWFAAFLSSSNVEVRAFVRRYLPACLVRQDDDIEMAGTSRGNRSGQGSQGSGGNLSTKSTKTTHARPSKQQLNL